VNSTVLKLNQNLKKSIVKTGILSIIIFLLAIHLMAQQRDLNYFIEQAKTNSPLINKTRNDNKLVSLDLKQMNSVLMKPEINVLSGVTFAPIISHDNNVNKFELVSAGATSYNGYDLALTDGGQYQAVVSVRQPLLAGSKYRTYEGKAGISGQINDNNIALTIHELEQVVGYQYILCLKSLKQAEISLSLLNALEAQLKILKTLVENAVYKQSDLILLQIEVQDLNSEYRSFNAEYITNLYDLNLICGIRDTARVILQDMEVILKPENAGRSNFLTAYRLDSLNILADQSLFELKYKPQLDLFADAGLFAAYIPYLTRFGFSTGLTFSWNIFDGNQRNIQRERSAISIQNLEFEKQNLMTQNFVSRNRIINQIRDVNNKILLREDQTIQYRKLYDTYTRELAIGEISVMDFKNLLKDITTKKQEILMLKMERQLLVNSYNYLNY
jgi:hypothetical protein